MDALRKHKHELQKSLPPTPASLEARKRKGLVNEDEADWVPNPKRKSKGKGKAKAQTTGAPSRPNGPPLVSVASIVGGMSAQKQRRILDRGVDVLVATPGRLWDILQEVSLRSCVGGS